MVQIKKKEPSRAGPSEMGQAGWLGLLGPTTIDPFFSLIFYFN